MKDRKEDLEQLLIEITEEAISTKLDYEQNGSNMDSGSVVVIHQNSPLLDDEKEPLADVAYNIVRRKENEK